MQSSFTVNTQSWQSSFFQNEEIFVQLHVDELDELDRITQAWIGLITALHKHRKHPSVMGKVPKC